MGFAELKFNLPMLNVGIGLSRNDLLIPPNIFENIRNCDIHQLGLGKRGGTSLEDNMSGNPRVTGLKQFISKAGDRYVLRATGDGKLWKDNSNTIKTGLATRGAEVLAEGDFLTVAKWTETIDFTLTSGAAGKLAYAHVGGSGTAGQAATSFNIPLKTNTLYEFSYTVANVGGTPTCNITANAASVSTALTLTNGAQTTQFTSNSTEATLFILDVPSSSGGDQFDLDDVSLKEVITPSTDISIYNRKAIFTNGVDVPQMYTGLRFLEAPGACIIGNAEEGAGSVTEAGANEYRFVKVTFKNAAGETTGGDTSNGVVVSDNQSDGKIRATGIPVGPSEVTGRNVYMTETGGSSYYKVTAGAGDTLDDNTTTELIINLSDATLVTNVAMPTDNTATTGSATTDLGGEGIDVPDTLTSALAGPGPCVATLDGAGSVPHDAGGVHSYVVVFVDSDGVHTVMGSKSNEITTVAGGSKVQLTEVPIGPTGTVRREIFRTKEDSSSPYYEVGSILNNTGTTLEDDNAESALGSDIVTNGAITAPAAEWFVSGDCTTGGGVANFTNAGAGSGALLQKVQDMASTPEKDHEYELTYRVQNIAGAGDIDNFNLNASANGIIEASLELSKANGTHTTTFTSSSSLIDNITFQVIASAAYNLDLDNISILEIAKDGTGLAAGDYSYKVTYLNPFGETTGSDASDDITVTADALNGQINLTDIPIGPTGVIARNIYRTLTGGSTYYLLATIGDNETTTYTDEIVDADINTNDTIPTSNTAAARPNDWIGTNNPKYALEHASGNTQGLIFFGAPENRNDLYILHDGSEDASQANILFFNINTGDNNGLVGGIEYGDRPIVFTKDFAWIIDKTDTNVNNWTYFKAPWKGGTISNRTLVKVLNDVYSMAPDGNIYKISTVQNFGDYTTQSLTRVNAGRSFDFNRWIETNVDFSYAEDFHGEYVPELRAVRFWVVRQGETEVDTAMTYFIDFDRWVVHDNQSFNSGFSASVSTIVREIDGTEVVYTGDYGGNVWKLDQSARNDNSNGYKAVFKTNRMTLPVDETGNSIDLRSYARFFGIYEEAASQDFEVNAWIGGRAVGAGTIDMTANYGEFILGDIDRDLQIEMYNDTADEDFFLMSLVIFYGKAEV
jgi:hypothetical protein